MNRPTKEEVDIALMLAYPGSQAGCNTATVLGAEVRALREDYAGLESRALAALEQMTVDATTAITGAGINADLAEQYAVLRATFARVEALPARWRETPHYDVETHDKCADQLEAALQGKP
jgi:hypothetical protein